MSAYDWRPMEPVPWPEVFDDPDWLYQVKWDGVRILSLWSAGGVRLLNRKGAERSAQYPELACLSSAFPAGTLLDGEIVVLNGLKPSFNLVLRRDLARRVDVIRARARQWPALYAVFDLLYLRGQDMRSSPLEERQMALRQIWPGNVPSLHLVESFSEGTKLFAAVGEQGLEGIVAKRRSSSYIPGKKSDAWRKVKHWRYASCVVGGYTLRAGQPSALLLGLYDDSRLIYVGRAGSGLGNGDWQALDFFLLAAQRQESPFWQPPRLTDYEIRWVEPKLAARVKFMEWSAALKLRSPVVLGFQPADSEQCSFAHQGV